MTARQIIAELAENSRLTLELELKWAKLPPSLQREIREQINARYQNAARLRKMLTAVRGYS